MNRPLPFWLWILLIPVLLPLFWIGNAIVALDDWFQARKPIPGRSAADPDKETPPRGWPAMPLEIKTADPICPCCDEPVRMDDTVAELHGIVWHVRCFDRCARHQGHG